MDPHTALGNLPGTSDPEAQTRRVGDLEQIAILAVGAASPRTVCGEWNATSETARARR